MERVDIGEAAALYAFMGWLTSRKEVSGPFSSHHEATPAADLIDEFCQSQGWEVEDERFYEKLRPYPGSESE